MTVYMQESEAARDFSRFLKHLKAGDEVQLECEGRPTVLARSCTVSRPRPSQIDEIEGKLRQHEENFGPVLLEPETVEILRMAHDEFNLPLEPRMRWD